MSTNPHPGEELGASSPLVPPLYQSSVYALPDLDALEAIIERKEAGFIYARDAHPNARHLANCVAALEGGDWGIVCGSGMSAISALLLANLKQGDRVVASECLYGRTTQLFKQELTRFGISAVLVNTSDLGAVAQALATPAQLFFVETLSNPLLRIGDLEKLAALARRHNCLFAVDNTFATPELVRPLDLGADFVIESLTKLMGGHSDVTLGAICGKGRPSDNVAQAVTIWGLASNPFDCWLALRGLETLALRVRTASSNAARLADWLAEQAGVLRVWYPGRPNHPDHLLAQQLLHRGYGNMLCFELAGGREAVNRFMRGAPGIPFSPSLGHTTTTCSHPASTSHRHADPAERARQGISDGLVRLSVGVEDPGAIQAELARGLPC